MHAKLTKLIIQLQQLNIEINAEEVADWLWLAAYKRQFVQQPEQSSDSYQLPEIKPTQDKTKDDTPAQEQPFKSDTSKAKESTAKLHTQQQTEQSSLTQETSTNALPFHTPAARALPHSLAISRALRPLVRRVASCSTLEIDEQATVQQIADMGIWLPVMRPQNVRWLELVLVIEDSPSMRLWYHTIKELQQLLEQQGAFSDIRVWRLKTEAKTQNVSLHTQSDLDARYPRHYKELINPAQRRLILVVSDCISPAWQSETLLNWLDAWGRQHPLTLINMLPQQLWTQTRLRYARLVKLSNSQAATANCYLQQQQTLPSWRKKSENDRLPIPLTTLEPDFLGLWAKFVVGNNANILMPSFIFHAEPLLTPQPTAEIDEESRFQRFHSVATPTAFQLACYLACSPLLQLPIIRLVQRVMFRPEQVQQVYLAEVFLSGLLKRISSDNCHPDEIEYDFLSDTLRDRFLDAGLLTDTVQVWEGISEYINAHYGCTLDFQAWLFNPKAANNFVLTDNNRGFARVSARILRRLGGEYEKLVNFLEGKENITENLKIPNKEIDKNYSDDLITAIPLNEAKLILVGDGAVGKTSLVNRLLYDKFKTNPKTEGIDRHQWNLLIDKDNIRLNVWDFGGQEVLHATHQFFLTKRSVYILVLDPRRGEQESRLEYWLKLIQSFGSDSPILIAINKSDEEHRLTLNQRFLKDKYPSIKEFYSVSCVTGQGIAELKQGIKNTVTLLPHIHFLMPASWFKLKQSLEQSTKNYISYDDYKNLCVQNEITEQISQSTLCSFLNDLGIVLNFSDDERFDRLRETNVLNPEWVTNAIYKLLNNLELFRSHGVFAVSDLARMLDSSAYPSIKEHQFIIDMMRKFELCFSITDTQNYLIPELLQNEEPDLNWNKDDSLRFEYHYDILPHSVFSRFIVRLHEYISQKTYWRTGVVLAHENNKALIKADIEDKKIFILVDGNNTNRRVLLGIIRQHFDYINKTIKGLEAKEKVPYKNVILDYQDLIDLEQIGEEYITIPSLKEKVNVKELLNGYPPLNSDQKTILISDSLISDEAQLGLNIEVPNIVEDYLQNEALVQNAAIFNVPAYVQINENTDILEELHQYLKRQHKIVIIKPSKTANLDDVTEIVAGYAHHYQSEYSAVLWVSSNSEDSLYDNFAKLSDLLDFKTEKQDKRSKIAQLFLGFISGKQRQDDKISIVKSWLLDHDHWLIVFDNVKTLELLTAAKDLFPINANGHILFTTIIEENTGLASIITDGFEIIDDGFEIIDDIFSDDFDISDHDIF